MSPVADFIAHLNSQTITVKVGLGQHAKVYKLPKELLRRASPWFEAALKDDRFVEGRDATINMPEDNADAFEMLIYFIYNDAVAFGPAFEKDDPSARSSQLLLCCETWTFAEKYLIPALRNCVIHRVCHLLNREFLKKDTELLPAATLASCWQASCEASPIRAIIADYIVSAMEKGPVPALEKCIADCPGLMQELHKSEALLHQAEIQDFPRYKKPVKILDQLKVQTLPEDPNTLYDSRWYDEGVRCEDCGYYGSGDQIVVWCFHCYESNCPTHGPEKRQFLCVACVRDL